MTAQTARGTGRQTDIPAASRTPLFSPDDSTVSSRPTPTPSPTPLTPQRGRPTARYPDALGRVPLHRRGTSKTYERLEDLLREAGYKETRVFTPETDRDTRTTTEKDGVAGNSVRASVGAVVDFISGIVSRGSGLSHEAAPLQDNSRSGLHPWSTPPSPLAHAIHIKNSSAKRVPSRSSLSRNGSSESILRRVHAHSPADTSEHTHTHRQVHQFSQGSPHHPRSYLKAHHQHHDQFNNRHHQLLNNHSSKSTSTKPNPPNARAYLRHMVSAPNIQPLAKRPSLSEASLRSHALGREHRNSTYPTFIPNDEDSIMESDYEALPRDNEHQVHPPLPRNWMESVAKALLSGVGGPAAVTSDAASTKTAATVSTRKSSIVSGKSNQRERARGQTRGTKPPLLCVQVQEVKSRTSEGQVARTRVMCRSTPTSRASSRVRSSAHEDRTNARNGGKRRERDQPRNSRKTKDRDAGVVPSLARTKAENDSWMAPRQRYATGWGIEGSAQAYPDGTWSDDSDHDDDDDDEEGELGLDRLLVPARRQHSIQSLRKHLQRPSAHAFGGRGAAGTRSPRSGRASPFGEAPSGRTEWGNASWSTNQSREWPANRGEEDEDGYAHISSAKWRRGLPSLTQLTSL